MNRHPVLCKPVREPLLDPLDYVAWRVGGGNEPPVVAVNLGVLDDGAAHVITTAQLLAGVTDPDGDVPTITCLTISSVVDGDGTPVDPARAVLVDNLDGTWTLTVADNWRGVVTMALTVMDGEFTVSGPVTASVEHVLWRNDGNRTSDLLAPYGSLTVVPRPIGGSWIECPSTTSSEITVRVYPYPLSVVPGDRLKLSWLCEKIGQGSYVFLSEGNSKFPHQVFGFGAQSHEFTVPAGVTGIVPFWNIGGVPVGENVYWDDLLLVRLNAAPVVTGSLFLPEAAETYTSTWTDAYFLTPFTDPDLDGAILLSGVTVSAGSLVDNGNDTWSYTPALGDAGNVTIVITVTDGVASTMFTDTFLVQTKAYMDAKLAWEAGAEWELAPANPYHPANGETGSTFGYWTPFDDREVFTEWWDTGFADKLTLNGEKAAAWEGLLAGLQLAQAEAVKQPAYTAAAVNGRPALTGDGVNTWMDVAFAREQTGFAMVVGQVLTVAGARTFVSAKTAISKRIALQGSNSTYILYEGLIGSSGLVATKEPVVLDGQFAGAGSSLGINGAKYPVNPGNTIVGTGLVVFAAYGASGPIYHLHAHISSIIVADGIVSDAIRLRLQGYFAWRYGTRSALRADHPYRDIRPTA